MCNHLLNKGENWSLDLHNLSKGQIGVEASKCRDRRSPEQAGLIGILGLIQGLVSKNKLANCS